MDFSTLHAKSDRPARSIGFGIERLGLLTLRAPIICLLVVVAVAATLGAGAARIEFDDGVSDTFRGPTDAYRRYQAFAAGFPDNENDILLVATAPGGRLNAAQLEALRWLHLDLSFEDGVGGILSVFSLRAPGARPGATAPLVPDTLADGDAYDALMKSLLADPDVAGSFLSRGGGSALLVVSVAPGHADLAGLVAAVRARAAKTAAETGLDIGLTGIPAMRVDTAVEIERLIWLYNGIGMAIAIAISLLALRSLVYTAIACAPPLVGVLCVIGALGWLGVPVTLMLLVVPTLALVIIFDDCLHLAFAIRRSIASGAGVPDAVRSAVTAIGPACVLAFLTTALALSMLIPTSSDQIRAFAVVAVLATLSGILFLFALLPPMAVALLRPKSGAGRRAGRDAVGILGGACMWIVDRVTRRPVSVAVVATALLAVCAVGFFSLKPDFRLATQVPDLSGTVATTKRVDRDFGGLNVLAIVIALPEGVAAAASETVAVAREVETALATVPGIGGVTSIVALANLAQAAQTTPEALLAQAPPDVRSRLVDASGRRTVVWVRLPDLAATDLTVRLHAIDAALDAVRAGAPGYSISLEGLPVLTATESVRMIDELRLSLLGAFAFAIALIGVAFRSAREAVAAVLPNLLPLAAAGTALALRGGGLEFASAVSLTIGIGIAVDNTIHVLRRCGLASRPGSPLSVTLTRAYARVGPVIVLATLVLIAGFAQTLFSPLPGIRLFGLVVIVMLVMAIFANIAYLPACLIILARLRRRWYPHRL